jgi:hypothetical protein
MTLIADEIGCGSIMNENYDLNILFIIQLYIIMEIEKKYCQQHWPPYYLREEKVMLL